MDALDPQFEHWLDRQEAEGRRVQRMGDYRQRQASELLLYVNHARLEMRRVRNGTHTDSAELDSWVEKIRDLSVKLGK
jgi:hypothetical protein